MITIMIKISDIAQVSRSVRRLDDRQLNVVTPVPRIFHWSALPNKAEQMMLVWQGKH